MPNTTKIVLLVALASIAILAAGCSLWGDLGDTSGGSEIVDFDKAIRVMISVFIGLVIVTFLYFFLTGIFEDKDD